MATIKDIANRLGVSVSTVSKGLNGASDISDELRQMVLDTAVEMGYTTKRSKKVENRKLCIFIENMNYETIDEFGYDMVLGFKQNAFRRKWDVDILPGSSSWKTLPCRPCFSIISSPTIQMSAIWEPTVTKESPWQ